MGASIQKGRFIPLCERSFDGYFPEMGKRLRCILALKHVTTKATHQLTKLAWEQVAEGVGFVVAACKEFRPWPGSRVERHETNSRAGGIVSAAPPAKASRQIRATVSATELPEKCLDDR
jgi:hypothetical protein